MLVLHLSFRLEIIDFQPTELQRNVCTNIHPSVQFPVSRLGGGFLLADFNIGSSDPSGKTAVHIASTPPQFCVPSINLERFYSRRNSLCFFSFQCRGCRDVNLKWRLEITREKERDALSLSLISPSLFSDGISFDDFLKGTLAKSAPLYAGVNIYAFYAHTTFCFIDATVEREENINSRHVEHERDTQSPNAVTREQVYNYCRLKRTFGLLIIMLHLFYYFV